MMTTSLLIFNELAWLPFPKRIQYHTCTMMYKTLKGMAPDYMTELFNKVSETHSRNLRSVDNDLLRYPYSRTSYYDRSFTIQGATQWNSLSLDVRNSPPLPSFKQNVKKYLLVC